MELAVRAGYSSQTKYNSGFAPLYVRLIKNSSQEINASCNAESATYSTSASPVLTEEALKNLFSSVVQAEFSDSDIFSTYEALKNEMLAYENTPTSLINTAIDSRVFSSSPWKTDSGVYPALFASFSEEEIRTQIIKIRDSLYVPSNSAIFITSPLNPGDVLALVKKHFSSWKNIPVLREDEDLLEQSAQKKFVIADPAFSKELTQIAVQFTSLSTSEADTVSQAFNSLTSPYVARLTNEPLLALRSQDYLACTSAQRSDSSRLILQALLEEPYSFSAESDRDASIAEQADFFVQCAKEAAALSRKDLIAAVAGVQSQYKSSMGNSVTAMQVLCDFWAHDPYYGEGGFYTRFIDRKNASFTITEKQLAQKVKAEEPFVFVIINTQTYLEQKEQFEKDGWALITKDNAAWYSSLALDFTMQSQAQKDLQTNQNLDLITRTYFADETLTDAQRFYAANADSFFTFSLQNGIPVTIKRNPQSQTVVLSLAIQGGELSSPDGELFLRTILVNAFASNIQAEINSLRLSNKFYGQTELKAWTEETVSYITVQCQKEDLLSTLTAVSSAVIFGEISPVMADNLVYEQKAQWGTKTQGPLFQLRSNALKSIYRGTSYEKILGTQNQVLSDTAFNSIALAYTKLLDAALYSVVIVGDVTEDYALTSLEKTFGTLKEQTVRKPNAKVPEPSFSSGTNFIQLSHIFMSDMPKEFAPDGVPVLVPTTEFSDPVVALFSTPDDATERQILNALLYNVAYRMQKILPAGTACTSTGASALVHVASIEADKIAHTKVFDDAYKTARESLLKDLNAEENLSLTRAIMSDWIVRELSGTLTNEGTALLIQEGILCSGPTQYLSDFLFLESLEAQDLLFYAEQFLPEEPFTVYSVDSQK